MRRILLALLLTVPIAATAEVRVFACEPEWAALAAELGGDLVETYSATTALQDPHYIQARPSLIAKLRRADLLVCSGAELEIGWLPALLQKANNRKVMPGSDGYLEASRYVLRLDATGNVDRAQGDIHPQGNPHIQTNPHNITAVAREISRRLGQIDSSNSTIYEENLTRFLEQWRAAIERWESAAGPLSGKRLITHHKSWVYLVEWLGLEEVAYLEPVAGLPPTATHLSRLTKRFAAGGADVIVRSPYQDDRPSEWLAERIKVPALILPLSIGGTDDATDLFSLYDAMIERLLGVISDV
jgi:zinc/manganese transport system substrate-binding protein